MQKQIRFDKEYIAKANRIGTCIYTAKEVADILEAGEKLTVKAVDEYVELLRSK